MLSKELKDRRDAEARLRGLDPRKNTIISSQPGESPTISDPVDKFRNLKDTPATYAGQALKAIIVKATEDGLEFDDVSIDLPEFMEFVDTATAEGLAVFDDPPTNSNMVALIGKNGVETSVYLEDSQADFEPGELEDVEAVAAGLELVNITTWNPDDKSAEFTLSQGDLQANHSGDTFKDGVRATLGKDSGKWYWEVKVNSAVDGRLMIGVSTDEQDISNFEYRDGRNIFYFGSNGQKFTDNNSAYGAAFGTNDLIGVALNLDDEQVTFYKNGVSQGAISFLVGMQSKVIYPALNSDLRAYEVFSNFGGSAFEYSVPSGYSAYGGRFPHGNRIALPVDLTTLSTDPGLEIKWDSTEPAGTSVMIETAVKGETVHTDEAVGTGDGVEDTFYLDYYPAERHSDVVISVDGTPTAEFTRANANDPREIIFNAGHEPGNTLAVTATYTGVTEPSETAEVQTLFLGGATGGTYDLGITGDMATLAFDDDASAIETALEAIFGTGLVTVAAATDFTITFSVRVRASGLIADFSGLTGATDPALTETTAYDSGDWEEQASEQAITNIPAGDLTGQHLWIRQTLETTDTAETPTLTEVEVYYGAETYGIFTTSGTVETL